MLTVAIVMAGCSESGGGGDSTPTSDTESVSTTQSMSPTPTPEIQLLEDDFDVGGYSLHMRCEGSGSPTIVYLHGLSHAPGDADGFSAAQVPVLLSEKYRFCAYDRANTGSSDAVPGPLTGKTSVRDLHRLLRTARIEPPYVLLGASFGGLIAEIYAATFPQEVVGMVLLDAGIPDEIDVDHLFPKQEQFRHEKHGFFGWADIEEQIDEFAAYEDAHALIGKEPAIPVTFLLAMPTNWTGPPGYEDAIRDLMETFVHRYSPGVVKEVDSPHYMEAAVPDIIAGEIEKIIDSASP